MAEKKPKKVWDNCIFIGEVMKSDAKKIRVELVARDGVKYINLREWYKKKSDGVWKPGLAGFAMPVAIPINGKVEAPSNELQDLIKTALEQAPDFAIADENNEVWY